MSLRTSDFAFIRFEPNDIQLLHKQSRKIYQYCECSNSIIPETQVCPPGLLRPIKYNHGVLYPKQKSTLEAELQVRRRAHTVIPFEEDEITNTFQPIIQCILALHTLNITFGSLSPANIVITDGGEILLREKRLEAKDNPYYFHKNSAELKKEDDWAALGQIMLQVATLKKSSRLFSEKQLSGIVEALMDKFSKGFIFVICIFIKKIKEKFSAILNLLKNQEKALGDVELNALYNSVRSERQRRRMPAVTNENINIYQNVPLNKPLSFSVHESPMRKVMATSFGNTLRKISKEDSENKKTPGQLRGRKSDRINKIIEKSNQFANDMLLKKNKQALTKIAPKPNIANISLFASELFRKKTKESPIIAPSPSKNIRSISRKK